MVDYIERLCSINQMCDIKKGYLTEEIRYMGLYQEKCYLLTEELVDTARSSSSCLLVVSSFDRDSFNLRMNDSMTVSNSTILVSYCSFCTLLKSKSEAAAS